MCYWLRAWPQLAQNPLPTPPPFVQSSIFERWTLFTKTLTCTLDTRDQNWYAFKVGGAVKLCTQQSTFTSMNNVVIRDLTKLLPPSVPSLVLVPCKPTRAQLSPLAFPRLQIIFRSLLSRAPQTNISGLSRLALPQVPRRPWAQKLCPVAFHGPHPACGSYVPANPVSPSPS